MSRSALLPAVLALGLLAGCGGADAASDSTSSASEDGAGGYPVTLENCGREVTIESAPQRAVSLNQGSTEILLSLGLADRMVGTATWTDPVLPALEADNAKVERLADNAPSYEAVLDKEPDIVTASFVSTLGEGGVTTPEDLAKLNIPSYISPADCTKDNEGDDDGSRTAPLEIDTVYQEVDELGKIFGVPDKSDELVNTLKDRVTKASETQAKDGTTAFYWFANSESPYLAGCCGAPGIISRSLGVKNVFDDSQAEWPQINWETVADRDPDVLVIGDLTRKSQTAETADAKIAFLESNPVTSQMTAVKEKRYITITGAEMNPSIRTVDGIEHVAEGLRQYGLTN